MKLNRKLVLVLALVLSLALATGGTLAYLTDRDSDANVFTLGNVDIDLEEDFEQGAELIPGKDIEKKPYIVNEGKTDAWVWATVAIPAVLDCVNDASQNVVHFNYEDDYVNDTQWTWKGADNKWMVGTATHEGIEYNVYTVLYQSVLKPGDKTPDVINNVYLDYHIDIDPNGDLYHVENGVVTGPYWNFDKDGYPTIYVSAYGIQAEGFKNVQEAYAAYTQQWTTSEGVNNGLIWGLAVDPTHKCWDGTADTSWYNDTDTTFVITTPEQLAGLAKLVDGGNSFEGKTIKLGKDICLGANCPHNENAPEEPMSFDPIGDDSPFAGTLDGQDFAIENLYQSGWAFGYEWGSYGSIGLFGELESATVKNLTIRGAECFVEGGDVGGITGSATGECIFENITLEDSVFATYNNGNGGIIGWSGAGTYTFKNITIKEDVVLAGLWGSFDSSIGGVVGQAEPGATYNFENVDVACRLDAYNDVTAAYDYYNYRMCGMLIGRLEKTTTIDGANYPDTSKYNITCKNVTVTYGDWANYHYCRPMGARGKRVEAGYAYDGIAADYDHSVCTMHHLELIAFDQIFGGDQFGVRGLPSYTGVKVVYNNK